MFFLCFVGGGHHCEECLLGLASLPMLVGHFILGHEVPPPFPRWLGIPKSTEASDLGF